MQGTKIQELESIRGLAAVLVVLFHVPKWNGVLDVPFVMNGALMVDLFFVLSGFVIFTAYGSKIRSGKDLLRFQFLRLGRLYPIHLLFLGLWLALESAKWIAASHGVGNMNKAPFADPNNLTGFLQHAFLLQGVVPGADHLSFNWPAWSISTEFYTYAIFALAVLFLGKRTRLFFAALGFGAVVLLLTEATLGLEHFIRCIAGFSIGCLTAQAVERATFTVSPELSGAVFVAILIFLQVTPEDQARFVLMYGLSALLIVTICRASGEGVLARLLKRKPLLWLGTISYSIYMSHAIVAASVSMIMKLVIDRTQITTLGASLAIALLLALVLVVSHVAYVLVELPFRERSRRFAASERPVGVENPRRAVVADDAPRSSGERLQGTGADVQVECSSGGSGPSDVELVTVLPPGR